MHRNRSEVSTFFFPKQVVHGNHTVQLQKTPVHQRMGDNWNLMLVWE